jgi:hypothetical protein
MNAGKQILKWTLITIIAFTTFNLFISSKYNVERSVEISASSYVVYGKVLNLQTWPDWATWWEEDSTIVTEYFGSDSGINSKISWVGEDGEGSLKIIEVSFADSLNTVLLFDGMPPAYGYWRFELLDETTKVTWGMKGEMPFFMRFMTLFMDEALGGDFEEGLQGLKEYCEEIPNE